MNTERIFTFSYRRKLIALLLAGTLAVTMQVAQTPLGNLLGMDLATTAYACQHSGGGGC